MLPQQMYVKQDYTKNQNYFGMPNDEIDSLMLNHIFSNSIYDCIIKYKGLFIRRLKYYNELNKTYFEKGMMFEGLKVIQILKNSDSENYRRYGDKTERTFFLIEDKAMGEQQIWISENGSRITKLIERIKDKWSILEIPNAPSDILPIYSIQSRTLIFYSIQNMNKLFRPEELTKYKTYEIKNYMMFDPTEKKLHFFFDKKLYFVHFGNIGIIDLTLKNPVKGMKEINFEQQI
jgi:hypothetical protein